jgi:hypothetical protein
MYTICGTKNAAQRKFKNSSSSKEIFHGLRLPTFFG